MPGSKNLIENIEIEESGIDMDLIKESIKLLPEFDSGFVKPNENKNFILHRLLRQILNEVDPKQLWGGLERIVTPEGHILWLCNEHIKEYRR